MRVQLFWQRGHGMFPRCRKHSLIIPHRPHPPNERPDRREDLLSRPVACLRFSFMSELDAALRARHKLSFAAAYTAKGCVQDQLVSQAFLAGDSNSRSSSIAAAKASTCAAYAFALETSLLSMTSKARLSSTTGGWSTLSPFSEESTPASPATSRKVR